MMSFFQTTGDYNLAKRCLKLCLSSDPTNAAALNNLAILCVQEGDLVKAKAYINQAKTILPDLSEIKSNVALMEKSYKISSE